MLDWIMFNVFSSIVLDWIMNNVDCSFNYHNTIS